MFTWVDALTQIILIFIAIMFVIGLTFIMNWLFGKDEPTISELCSKQKYDFCEEIITTTYKYKE